MANTLFVANGVGPTTGNVIAFDCYPKFTYEFSNTITQHPVERGGVISDHAYNNPVKLSFQGVVSSSPVVVPFGDRNSIGDASGRTYEAYNMVKALWKNRTPFTIYSDFEVFHNCIISSLSIPQETGFSGESVIVFNIEVEQINVVSSADIYVNLVAEDKRDDSSDNKQGSGAGGRGGTTRTGRALSQAGRDTGSGGRLSVEADLGTGAATAVAGMATLMGGGVTGPATMGKLFGTKSADAIAAEAQ